MSETVVRMGCPCNAEQVVENGGKGIEAVVIEADFFRPLQQEIPGLALFGNAGEVALDIGGKDGNTGGGKAFGENLQGHRLAGAGGAGDQPVAVGLGEIELLALGALADKDPIVGHQRSPIPIGAGAGRFTGRGNLL